jgi:allantoin racemase
LKEREEEMKIRSVAPVITESFGPMIIEEFERVARPDTEISNVFLESGPASVESAYDEAVAIPDVIARVREAEEEGMDAVIINCFGDPGLDAAREVVSIPVVGPCEASMHVAAILGHKFSVITVLERLIPELELHAQKYGVGWKLASARSIDLPVLDLEKGREQFVDRMVDKAVEAIEEDGAHVIVLGCTGLAGLDQQVKNGLREKGYEVPVIDPASIALKVAEALVDSKLAHSKRTYPYPPEKEIVGYGYG